MWFVLNQLKDDDINSNKLEKSNFWVKENKIFLILMFGLLGGAAISAYFIRSHPIFMIITILLSRIYLVIGAEVSNIWAEIISEEALGNAALAFPITTTIMDNLPLIMLAGMVMISVAAYAGLKRGDSGFGGI